MGRIRVKAQSQYWPGHNTNVLLGCRIESKCNFVAAAREKANAQEVDARPLPGRVVVSTDLLRRDSPLGCKRRADQKYDTMGRYDVWGTTNRKQGREGQSLPGPKKDQVLVTTRD
jgi:hypothetical protein